MFNFFKVGTRLLSIDFCLVCSMFLDLLFMPLTQNYHTPRYLYRIFCLNLLAPGVYVSPHCIRLKVSIEFLIQHYDLCALSMMSLYGNLELYTDSHSKLIIFYRRKVSLRSDKIIKRKIDTQVDQLVMKFRKSLLLA